MLKTFLVNSTVIRHLAARAIINEAWETFADGLVVLSKADGIFATCLVFTDISALLNSLCSKLALKAFTTVPVFQTLVLYFCCASTNQVIWIAVV